MGPVRRQRPRGRLNIMGDDSGLFQMDVAIKAGNSGGTIYAENENIICGLVAHLNR